MARGKPNYVTKLKPGETYRFPLLDKPEIQIVGKGRSTYLWVGGRGCVGTISGPVTLRLLAQEILGRLGRA